MSSDEDSSAESDTSSDSASLSSAEGEDFEGFRYHHCGGISFLTKEADSRERITRIPDKLAQIFFNHDKKKCLGNGT